MPINTIDCSLLKCRQGEEESRQCLKSLSNPMSAFWSAISHSYMPWCRSSFKFWLIDGHYETAICAEQTRATAWQSMDENELNWIMRAQMNQFLMFLYRSCCMRSLNHLNCIFDIDMSFRCFHLIKSKKKTSDRCTTSCSIVYTLHIVQQFTHYQNAII